LDAIYAEIEKRNNHLDKPIELLLICGDFQAVRNWQDLQCMAVPNKYRELKDFYKYVLILGDINVSLRLDA
jgi:lariat debranching enzyme